MLYNDQGYPAYEEVLAAKPGMWVALVTPPMTFVTEWALISVAMQAEFTGLVKPEVSKRGVSVRHYVLWDGEDRMRRFEMDNSVVLSRYYSPILLTLH